MSYVKKVCVLKQIDEGFSLPNKSLGGIVRMEKDSGVITLFCSVIDVALTSGGEFYLFICDGKREIFSIPLGVRPSSFSRALDIEIELNGGFAAGLCFVSDDLPLLAAFGLTDGYSLTAREFKKAVAEKCFSMRKGKQQKDSFRPNREYDDEAVATENYYDLDDGIREKLTMIEDIENERLRSENGKSTRRGEKEKDEGENNGNRAENEANCGYGKEYSIGNDYADGTNADHGTSAGANERADDTENKKPFDEENPYFFYAGKEIDILFDKFPEDFSLRRIFPASRWVRISYSADKFYIVGVIYSLDGDTSCTTAKYICYGVPERYSATPPQPLKGYCSFVPISLFDLHGDGFWMMFQDAVSGDCVQMSGRE